MTTNPGTESSAAGDLPHLTAEEIEAMCPADPDIMYAREGDIRGLRKVQAQARARREELARKYPEAQLSWLAAVPADPDVDTLVSPARPQASVAVRPLGLLRWIWRGSSGT